MTAYHLRFLVIYLQSSNGVVARDWKECCIGMAGPNLPTVWGQVQDIFLKGKGPTAQAIMLDCTEYRDGKWVPIDIILSMQIVHELFQEALEL